MFKIVKAPWSFLLAGLALTVFSAAGSPALAKPGGQAMQGVVNINTASPDELQLLSGVGPAKAERIVEYRAKHPFRTVEELGRVKGIGPKTVRKLRLFLTVRGPTTVHPAGAPARRADDGTTAVAPPPPAPAPAPVRRANPDPVTATESLGAPLSR